MRGNTLARLAVAKTELTEYHNGRTVTGNKTHATNAVFRSVPLVKAASLTWPKDRGAKAVVSLRFSPLDFAFTRLNAITRRGPI